MKKILSLLILGIFSLPALATCSIDANEPCTASILDDANSTLIEKIAPNPLDELKKTDAFRPEYKQPYHDALINTSPGTQDYNSNCQFGVCLPGVQPSEGEIIE